MYPVVYSPRCSKIKGLVKTLSMSKIQTKQKTDPIHLRIRNLVVVRVWFALQGTTLHMHLAAFSFSKLASIRGPPEHDTVRLLLDEILLDGFITQGEPLLITQPADLMADLSEATGYGLGFEYTMN